MTEREQTTIRLPAEIMEQIKREADRLGISFNELMMTVINNFLDHHQQ